MKYNNNIAICNNLTIDKNLISRFNASLESLFYIHRNHIDKYQKGLAYSTVDDPTAILDIPEFKIIFESLVPYIAKCANNMGFNDINYIDIVRAWCNKMYKGSSASTHVHPNCDMVAIYYLQAKKESAKIFFTSIENGLLFEDQIDSKNKYYAEVESQTLICHDARIYHGVERHQIDEPRICMILDLTFN